VSNPKGRRNENDHRDKYLQRVWPDAERKRLQGIYDFGDFTNVGGWLIESKWRKATSDWRIATWVREVREKVEKQAPTAPWVIIASTDKRKKKDGLPIDLAIMDAEQYFRQLARLKVLEREMSRHD
jgi:hypothetical protein